MNTNHDALREALEPFAKLFHSLQADFDGPLPTAFDATISTEDVRRAAYALSQPEAAAQCWCETCRPVTLNDMRMVLCPDCGNKRCPKATHHDNACTNSNEVGQPGSSWANVKPLSASPAAPEGAKPEQTREEACMALLEAAHAFWKSEKNHGAYGAVKFAEFTNGELVIFTRGEYRDKLMAAVGGIEDGPHYFNAAQPPHPQPQAKPWGEWDAVPSVLPPEPQPQAQGEPTVGWVHGWELERANESKRWAMKECRELREAIAKRDAALDACVEALEGAKAGLQWYRDADPKLADGSDDEADQIIDAAITQAQGQLK